MPLKFYHQDSVLRSDIVLSNTLLQFKNCKLLRRGQLVSQDLWVESGQILDPEPIFFKEKRPADIEIDCDGCILSGGFIDAQINGAFGVDFSTCSENFEDSVKNVCKGLLKYGVTSFCPTVISSQPSVYKKILPKLKHASEMTGGAKILGAHLEGPFISEEKRGAHPVQNLISGFSTPELALEEMTSVYGQGFLDVTSTVTVAPELPNVLPLISELVDNHGIKVSLGHSLASVADGEGAVKAGASGITHLFNAMLPFHHRDPGLVGLLASKCLPADRTLFFGVISDGIHTHDSALRIAHKTHPAGLMLITDAIAALGLQDGAHIMGDVTVEVKGNRAVIAGTQTLAGSVSSMDFCVRHLVKAARCSPIEALECASLHPAQFLGITDRKGTLDFGTDADFVLLDTNLNPRATFISGQLVWALGDF